MIYTVLNLKGGAGKTTVLSNLATELPIDQTLVIDANPETGAISEWSRLRREFGHSDLNTAIMDSGDPVKVIQRLARDFKHILIDTPPERRDLIRLYGKLSDLIILPMQTSQRDIVRSIQTVTELEKVGVPKDRILCVLNGVGSETETLATKAELRDAGLEFVPFTVRNSTGYRKAMEKGLSNCETAYETLNYEAKIQTRFILEKVERNYA